MYSSPASSKAAHSTSLSIEPVFNSQGSVSIKPIPAAGQSPQQKLPSGLTITKVVQSTPPKQSPNREGTSVRVINIATNSNTSPRGRQSIGNSGVSELGNVGCSPFEGQNFGKRSDSLRVTPNKVLSPNVTNHSVVSSVGKGIVPVKQNTPRQAVEVFPPKVPVKKSVPHQLAVDPFPSKEVLVDITDTDRQAAAMNDYELYCEKEQSLRKLLKTFPGADIMEAQDILVECGWNIDKAIEVAKTRPLRVISRRRSSSQTNYVGIPSNFAKGVVFESENVAGQRGLTITDVKGNVTEEIVLESSDDDSVEAIQENSNYEIQSSSLTNSTPVTSSNAVMSLVQKPHTVQNSNSEHKRSLPVEPNNSETKDAPSKKLKRVIQLEDSDDETASNSSLSVELSSTVKRHERDEQEPALINSGKVSEVQSQSNLLGSSIDTSLQTTTSTPENSEKASGQSSPASSCTSSTENFLKTKDLGKKYKKKRKEFESDEEEYETYGDTAVYDSDDSESGEVLTPARSAVLSFFQDCTSDELLTVPGCSKKKAEAVIGYRPFEGWADLVQKLNNDKSLSTDLLNGAKQVMDMRTAISRIMNKCQKIAGEMEGLVEKLKECKGDSKEYVAQQPSLLNDKMQLAPYQMLGLNWLILMHNQQVNGILADEMGLGKTVQAISLLAYLREQEIEDPHLIVVPSSTLDNWKNELEMWWPSVSILLYRGSQEARRELRYRIINDEVEDFNVMLTTYNMVTSSNEDRSFFKRLSFYFVIFDEAHMLKNMSSQRYQNLMRVRAERRLLLTGTPLQNNLVELMSLLIFVMPDMFSSKTPQLKQMFSAVSKSDEGRSRFEKEQIEHAKRIMKPFVLRRLKSEVLQDLPPKEEETKFCPMTEFQRSTYINLVATLSAEVNEKREKILSGSGMMMQLRKAANHPLLLRNYFNSMKLKAMSELILKEPTHKEAVADVVFEDMQLMSDFELHRLCKQYESLSSFKLADSIILDSGKFQFLDTVLPEMKEKSNRILLFSQFTMVLDIVEEYMKIREYKYLRLDGAVPVAVRQPLIDQFNEDPEIFIFLLSTRAGGLGINLTAANVVLLHDIDFNPYNDKQAEDRCHRVGQLRNVLIIRMISKDTIEEGILQRVKEKLKLEKDITSSDGDNEEDDCPGVATLLKEALNLSNEES